MEATFHYSLGEVIFDRAGARSTDWSHKRHQKLQEDVHTVRYEDFMKSSESFDQHVMAAYAAEHARMWLEASGPLFGPASKDGS